VHLIFDLDGVLLDSETDLSWLTDALERTLGEFDVPATDEAITALGPTRVRDFESVAEAFGVDTETLWEVRNRNYLAAKVRAIEEGSLRPFPDVERLRDLRPRHDLHVISNSPQEVVETFVVRYDLDDLFEVRVGRGSALDDLSRLKPDEYLFERFAAEVEAVEGDGEAYLYVGDSESDWEFARNVGIPYVHVIRGGPYTETVDGADVPTVTGLDEFVTGLSAGEWTAE
jgi:phosphoglycolate phosphatase